MFIRSSEDEFNDQEASFIVLFYEKSMRKRTFAKSVVHKQRIDRKKIVEEFCIRQPNFPRMLEELMPNRDSKMRRFCNYFLTLFNQKKLNPFTQFVHSGTLKKVKLNVRLKMQYFTKGINKKNKSRKKSKKDEPKPNKLPSVQQINSMK